MSLLDCTIACSKCEIVGIHACPGRPLPPPTPEDEARLTEALDRIFGKRDKEQDDAMVPNVCTSSSKDEE